MVRTERYRPRHLDDWDAFIDRSRNSTFLIKRKFMDYHSERFEDHSIVALLDDRIVAALPANKDGSVLVSHAGLTYGGLILDRDLASKQAIAAFNACVNHARAAGFRQIIYKPSPYIYHSQPSEEDLYCLFLHGAKLTATGLSSVIPIQRRPEISTIRRKQLALANRKGVTVERGENWSEAWRLLSQVLEQRHGALPTHSLDDILLLSSRFPNEIELYVAHHDQRLIAMLVSFDCGRTVHVQYISASVAGRKLGGVDAIIHHLINERFPNRDWLDFGVSTEQGGRHLNEGLLNHKESFGARTILYNQYQLQI